MKKLMALLLAAVMCLGLFVGCQPAETPDDSSTPSGGDEIVNQEGPLFSSTTEIQIYTHENSAYDFEDGYLDKLLLSQENIDVKLTEGFDMQQMLTDKSLPDITWMNAIMYGNEYGPKGAFLNILDYLDQMPNLKAVLKANPDAVEKNLAADGKLYHVPVILEGETTTYGFIYREDIFKKHNLEFPTTRDEFYNVLKKLKELYPNSYPFVLRQMSGNMQGFMYLCMSFGTELNLTGATSSVMNYNHKTKEWYYGPTSEGMKDMVTFLAKLYKEGLLHKSTITLTPAQWVESFTKGDTADGVSFIGWDKMDRIPAQLQPAGEELNPEFKLVHGAPIKFNDLGEAAVYKQAPSPYNFLLSSTMSAERRDAALKFIDWLYSEEGIETTNWGKEGETFEVDANGNKKYVDSLLTEDDPQYTRGLVFNGVYGVRDFEAYAGWQSETHKNTLLESVKYATLENRPVLVFNEEEQNIYDTYWVALHDYARGNIQKFIAGERDVAEWDAYVAEVESDAYKFNDLMKIHEDCYNRMQKERPDIDKLLGD